MRKYEKEIDEEFQLDYSEFKNILDWPNGYITLHSHNALPSQKTP